MSRSWFAPIVGATLGKPILIATAATLVAGLAAALLL
jgi:hypothetical protein